MSSTQPTDTRSPDPDPPKRYQVTVSRADKLWVVTVQELPGGFTDVVRFDDAETEVRDIIYLLTGEPEGTFELDWHYVQGERDYTQAVADLRRWEAETSQASSNRDRARLEIITTLRAAGLSQRNIAEVIGTSHQRVAQLIAEAS